MRSSVRIRWQGSGTETKPATPMQYPTWFSSHEVALVDLACSGAAQAGCTGHISSSLAQLTGACAAIGGCLGVPPAPAAMHLLQLTLRVFVNALHHLQERRLRQNVNSRWLQAGATLASHAAAAALHPPLMQASSLGTPTGGPQG